MLVGDVGYCFGFRLAGENLGVWFFNDFSFFFSFLNFFIQIYNTMSVSKIHKKSKLSKLKTVISGFFFIADYYEVPFSRL